MNVRSLRFRLVLWYASWLALVFAAASGLLYFGVRHYLENNLAQAQLRRGERIAASLPTQREFTSANLTARITTDFAPEASNRFIRIAAAEGPPLYQSGPPRDHSFDPALIGPLRLSRGTRREKLGGGGDVVIGTVQIRPGLFVETGESLAPAFGEMRRLLLTLVLGFAVVACVALAGGSFLVHRAMQPIDKMIASAERITSRNLSERLPVSPAGDEFAHLSQAFNRMIMRLDEAFEHNRRFLADASHELRTPLTVLRAELESMVQRVDLDADLRATAGDLFEEVERLVLIVESLFALSRFESGECKTEYIRFDLTKLVVSTAEQMSLLAEDKQITIAWDTATTVFVEGDRARLKQIVVNLLDNAIKYTPSGGRVEIAVKAQGSEAIYEVRDTGIGIPPEALRHVFDRFFRVDEARSREAGGAGIGLSIVKAIATAHGGQVVVESAIGVGSCFRLKLPLATLSPAAPPLHAN